MPSTVFYPSLANLLPIDRIPESLGSVRGGIENIFDKIFYKDLQVEKSPAGDAGFYTLTLVLYTELGFEIPGTGVSLWLNRPNPPYTNQATLSNTEIPISLSYKLEILKYVRTFSGGSFSEDAAAFFALFLEIIDVEPSELLGEAIGVLVDDPDPITKFVSDFNDKYSVSPQSGQTFSALSITTDPSVDAFEDLLTQMEAQGFDHELGIFTDYINTLNTLPEIYANIRALFNRWLGNNDLDDFKKLLIPQFSASINSITIGVEFPSDLFRAIDTTTNQPYSPDQGAYGTYTIGAISFSSETGFEFTGTPSFSLPRAEILRTGFQFTITNMKLDFSRTKNIPEAVADGRPSDFIGVYIQEADVYFPPDWNFNTGSNAVLKLKNMLAGTGGLSGSISMESTASTPFLEGTFGSSIDYALDRFEIIFQQNAIISSDIHGTLTVPGFTNTSSGPATLDINIHLAGNGDFSVTASDLLSPPTWEIADVLSISVSSAFVGRKNGRFYLGVTGEIDFIAEVPVLGDVLPKGVEVKKLIIWDDGNIEFEGGNLILPNAIGLHIGPVKLAITALSMGSYERGTRKYKYVGFDGGINISPGGVDARANGVKLYYSVDGGTLDIFIRIEGIAIDLIIPGSAKPEDAAAIISGFLSMKEPDSSATSSDAATEYTGGVSLSLPRPQIAGSAGMRLQPNWPAFLIDASLELSTPIPLGTTGLSIYGFRGLLGLRYIASKTTALPDDTHPWYEYYKAKISPDFQEGIQVSKFSAEPGFSLGAGVSLATGADQGKAFSSKLFLLLSLPEVILLQGQGAILRERVGLDTVNDPPFSAMIAISKQSVEAAFGVNYKVPEDSGKIAAVDGLIEMGFFFGNSSAWYINVGRDLPAEKRIQAQILTLFNAYFYLMLSSGGIKAGAGASWAFSKSFGPVGVEAGAYIDLAGKISFKPKQIGGSIQLGGYARVKVFKFKLGLSISASLAAEAPKPFIVTGSVSVAIDLPKPLKDVSVDIDFTWTFDPSLDTDPQDVIDAADFTNKPPAKALSMVTNETFGVLYYNGSSLPDPDSTWENYVIPMDSYIDFEFTKGVKPDLTVTAVNHFGGVTSGSNFTEFIPPQRGKSDQVKHSFEVKNIQIFYKDSTGWVDYNPFAAYIDLSNPDPLFSTLTSTQLAQLKYGFWQKDTPNKYTKLRVLAQNPLSFLSQGTGNVIPEELGIGADTIFCEEEAIAETCIDFDVSESLDNIATVSFIDPVFYRGVMLKMNSADGVVVLKPDFSLQNALAISPGNNLEIILPEACASLCLSLSGNDSDLTIEYYRKVDSTQVTSSNLPIYEWDLIDSTTITPATLSDTFCYDDPENPVERVLIINGSCGETSVTCGELTAEASQLETFLDTLASNSQLVSTFKIYPDNSSIYDSVFEETVLYDPPYEYTDIVYTVQLVTATQLIAEITDGLGYDCQISMELAEYDPAFNWADVTKIDELEPDPDFENNGANYHFLALASTSSGNYTVKGVSCYPIEYCLDSCFTSLHKICYLPLSSYEYNQTIPTQSQVTNDNEAMLNAILKITPPVWRPYTDFFVLVETKDTISNISSPPGPTTDYHAFGFRTAGPVGHFHELRQEYTDLAEKDRADQYRLASLKPYIDYSTSYPNADGNILNAKPLFYYDPKLLLFYKYAHVYTMLRYWADYGGLDGTDIELNAVIKDPADPNASPSKILAALSSNKGPQSLDMQTLDNLVSNGDPCSEVAGPVEPDGIHSEIDPGSLLPEKLYTAVYYVRKKGSSQSPSAWNSQEVHRYPFQTSRYADFTEQVQSYVLSNETGNERYAVFNIDLELTSTQISAVQAVIGGTESSTDPLLQQFADPFDRIITGILNLPQLDPPQTTEFNIIRDSSNSNAIVAFLVRSPEPFNDPKLPLSELISTLTLSVNSGSTSGYQLVFSKDRSKIYLTKSTSISTGSGLFTFKFKLYDGTAYQVISTETATITIA